MMNRKNFSLASLAASAAVAVLAFGLATPQANAQIGFGISIGSQPYADDGYVARPGYVYQQGYWQSDPDGDGNARWIPGGWVIAPYQGGYYGNSYYGAGYPAQYQGRYYGRGERYDRDRRGDDRGYRRHGDDDDDR
jgi:hypothetical protein